MTSANTGTEVGSFASRFNLQQYVVYLGFLAIFLFFALMLRDSGFLTVRNLSNIVLQTAPVTIMAIGLVFVMSAGEIDLRSARSWRSRRSPPPSPSAPMGWRPASSSAWAPVS